MVGEHIASVHAAFLLDVEESDEEGELEKGGTRSRLCPECGRQHSFTRAALCGHLLYVHRSLAPRLARMDAEGRARMGVQADRFLPICRDRNGIGHEGTQEIISFFYLQCGLICFFCYSFQVLLVPVPALRTPLPTPRGLRPAPGSGALR